MIDRCRAAVDLGVTSGLTLIGLITDDCPGALPHPLPERFFPSYRLTRASSNSTASSGSSMRSP
jgi:hypothetical protein